MAENWKQFVGQTVAEEIRLREFLGGSEHSAVFLADYPCRNPKAATIKLVAEDTPCAERQARSWKLASTVSHPNLIPLLRTGNCHIRGAKFLYGVMEYADEKLSQVISERALTVREATDMLRPALGALAYLHGKGIAHGHLKPANIMASGDRLKLSTDGLQRAGEPISEPSAYDPPERTNSPAADMWSLGMSLVEVLTQRLPPWDPRGHSNPVLPASLSGPLLDIAGHCLQRNPKFRWTAGDATRLLDPTTPVRTPQRRAPTRVRNLLVAAIVLIILLATAASVRILSHSPRVTAEPSPIMERTTETATIHHDQPRIAVAPPPDPTSSVTRTSRETSPRAHAAPPATLQSASAGTSGGAVVHQVVPDVPARALDTIHGTVRVAIRVSVDGSGNVTTATIATPGPSFYFANLALKAAQQWRFAPDRGPSRDWTIRFHFTHDGTKAFAEQTGA
jgi:TonB family protein